MLAYTVCERKYLAVTNSESTVFSLTLSSFLEIIFAVLANFLVSATEVY